MRAAGAMVGGEERARRDLLGRLDPRRGPVLEVSIGPGVNLPYLAENPAAGEIFGLDISLGQLKRCREYVAHRGWDIQLQLGNAEQLPYQDNSFDGVFHVGGINFFNDKGKAIQEMIRVAKPGSRILISDEKEKAAKAYESLIPGFRKKVGQDRDVVVAPLALIPPEMENLRIFDVWGGWFYCIEFCKP
jgi:ubiquinone/menaquinone biosynthesis C-methylase UbiE